MEIQSYAPVTMTTLCRYEHFKRCLESLERCTGAKKTDVYVALDYPANEKHVVGWKKIDAYLREKEQKNGFKSLNVRRRDHNCGVGHAGSNGALLYQEIKQITDRFISFEDDNEFSPCFLEYINKGLEKYKDDDRVISICAFTPIIYNGKENVYFARDENAWGHGVWIKKKEQIEQTVNLIEYKKILDDFWQSLKIFYLHPISLYAVLDNVILNQFHGDMGNVTYCFLKNKYSLFPSIPLVRNWGNDGSGIHNKITDKYNIDVLNEAKTFEIDDVEIREKKIVRKMLAKAYTKHWYGNIAILFRYIIWKMTKKDLFVVLKETGLLYDGK